MVYDLIADAGLQGESPLLGVSDAVDRLSANAHIDPANAGTQRCLHTRDDAVDGLHGFVDIIHCALAYALSRILSRIGKHVDTTVVILVPGYSPYHGRSQLYGNNKIFRHILALSVSYRFLQIIWLQNCKSM